MYALGYMGIAIILQTTVKWYQYFYAPPAANSGGLKILVPLGLIGFAMVFARVLDAAANPIVAYLSDNCKSSLGRRRPFIIAGSIPLAATFILLWYPPVKSESPWNFLYLAFMLGLLFSFFTIVVDPYLALIGDISRTKEERIRLTTMQGAAQIAGVLAAEAGSALLIGRAGFQSMGIILGLFALGTILLTPMAVREIPVGHSSGPSPRFLASLRMTLKNRDFICYLIPYLAIWFGINTLTISMPYISEILLHTAPENSGYLIGRAFIVAFLVAPLFPRLSLAFGKKSTLMVLCLVFGTILIITGLFGTLFSLSAATVIICLAGIPLSGVLIIPNSMVADIAEQDGLRSGHRREGMFFGTQGLIQKMVIGLSSVVIPLIFSLFGYSAAHPLGLKLCGPIAGCAIIASTFALRGYSMKN